jgi:hypothetical protein
MSVITDKQQEDHWTEGAICSFCCVRIVSYPFLFWLPASDTPICICGKCCVRVQAGLIADIEQVVAIKKLQERCPHLTLMRKPMNDLDRPHNIIFPRNVNVSNKGRG